MSKDTLVGPAWVTSEALWDEAERLVVGEGWSYPRVCEELRIPLGTLQKRASKGEWQKKRHEAISYSAQARRLKALLLKKAIEAVDGAADLDEQVKSLQLVHGWRGVEAAFPEHRYERPPAEKGEGEPEGLEQLSDDDLQAIVERRKGRT